VQGTEPAVRVRGLTKRFGQTLAVSGIDLDVPRGSFLGLVGPNGAGKTTTLSMATGLLRPDEGSVEVLGHDVWADPVAAKKRIGILPDGLRLFDRLTGLQLVTYAGLLRGMDRPEVVDPCLQFELDHLMPQLCSPRADGFFFFRSRVRRLLRSRQSLSLMVAT
jgi:ABC-2 type transport system ATP-binding protein